MPTPRRLTLAQVRAVHRLVGECREVGDDPGRWRPHLLAGVNVVVGGQFAMPAELCPAGPATRVAAFASLGLAAARVRDGMRQFAGAGGFTGYPVTARFAALPAARKTRLRRDLVADGEWYGSAAYRGWHEPAGLDDGLLSAHPGPSGSSFFLSVSRAAGDPPFTRRDAKVVHLLQLELAPHLGRSLATARDPLARLSPRLRQTLDGLLAGDGEKQVAARLGIRPATVREYVQALYRHLGVGTRGELLALVLRRYRRPPDPPPAG